MIEQRNVLRIAGDYSGEIELQKAIRRSVKVDRAAYLDELASAGAWTQLKMLRRGPNKMKGRLRNQAGEAADNSEKAETLADYFENVQWRVRPLLDISSQEPLGPTLDVKLDNISLQELQKMSMKLKLKKSCGVDEIPGEYWRVALEDGDYPLSLWLLEFCNSLWTGKVVPDSWHESRVAALFKKGDLGDCGNYPYFPSLYGLQTFCDGLDEEIERCWSRRACLVDYPKGALVMLYYWREE